MEDGNARRKKMSVSGRKYRASLTVDSSRYDTRGEGYWASKASSTSYLPPSTQYLQRRMKKKYVYSQSGNFLRRRSHAKDGAKVIDQATRLGLTLPALNQQLPFLLRERSHRWLVRWRRAKEFVLPRKEIQR